MTVLATRTFVQEYAADDAASSPRKISLYGDMNPNLAFNVSMIAIFGVLFVLQAGLGLYTRQRWMCVSFMCACGIEVAGYVGRALSHNNTSDIGTFLLQNICLTLAPVFTMAGIYYQLAKLVKIYGPKFAMLKSPIWYSWIFIACDVISLIIQAVGGGMSGNAAARQERSYTGDHVFVAGLAFQVASMSVFLLLWFHLLYQIFMVTRLEHTATRRPARALLHVNQLEIDYKYCREYECVRVRPRRWVFIYFPHALTIAVLLVYVRCIYRVVELAQGWGGYLITHEVYLVILDALMISLATAIMTVFHPGFAFKGRTVRIPIDKVTKPGKADVLTQSDYSVDVNPSDEKDTVPPC
ncbi:RTA1 domain-containing protein LALA0_S16e00540g [Lachancea lanzarotensis]|uniref:Sphingoid long-chain base transporter RSB1 n=1 Tax=Lachancea lanzarotensis TaxID=1245769 RepID=A0A0C7NFA6_9SACH|nr:uncharacterized protein LALA0_S16e00540g [Lachancea lanzarotensis]CEP65007.1 LALA0S16e00540g1_1 [Lachancea lanzarotensis]